MINKKETISIVAVIVVLAISISLFEIKKLFLPTLLAIAIIVILNVLFKKLMSYYLDLKTHIKMWEIRQWGYKNIFRFKKPVNLGLTFPIILKVISVGYINFTASLTYDVESTIYRAAKKHGLYGFSEVSEAQIGAIAAAGIIANLIGALVGYLIGFPYFARLSLSFAFWNLIPLSALDGNKIFFGSKLLWVTLMLITLVGLALSIFVV